MARAVDAGDRFDRPVARGQRIEPAVVEAVEMREAAALRLPEQAAVGEHMEGVVEVDPAVRPLAEHDFCQPGRRIDLEQIERLLVAAQPLDVERLAVGRPVDAGQIEIGVGTEVDTRLVATVGVHEPELDRGIGGAGDRIALLDDRRPLGADRRAADDRDLALVGALDGQSAVAGCPPGAGEAR